MKEPNKTMRSLGVGRSVIKYHAHALTLFAVFWSLPSGLCVMGLVFAIQAPGGISSAGVGPLCALLVAPTVHLWSIIAAIYYWRTERKQKVTILKTRGEIGIGF